MNTLWDGVFHTLTWVAALVGLGLLYARVSGSPGRVWASRVLWGWMLLGCGVFNVVEGIVDHHILGIHHVLRGQHQTLADILLLVLGALLIALGWLVQQS